VARKDVEAAKQLLGKTRKAFIVDKHHKVAIDRAGFYAVTGAQVENLATTLRTVSVDDVRWFIEEEMTVRCPRCGKKVEEVEATFWCVWPTCPFRRVFLCM
jgi:DNA-directed RNA polymerase subunit RPC12/RpoP